MADLSISEQGLRQQLAFPFESFGKQLSNKDTIKENEEKKLRFVDLFAGIGGFHYALHTQGAECVFAAEWDNRCRETYEQNFKKMSPHLFLKGRFVTDVTQIVPSTIPDMKFYVLDFLVNRFQFQENKKDLKILEGHYFSIFLKLFK